MTTLNSRQLGPYENPKSRPAEYAYRVTAVEYNLLQQDIKNINTQVNTILAGNLYQGVLDCSTNPNYPAGTKDFFWKVSVAGLIGGGAGTAVEIGDEIICITTSLGGTEAAVGAEFMIVQKNMIPCTVAVLRTGTNNTDFVTAKTLADQGIVTAAATIVALSGGTTSQLALTTSAAQKGLTITQTAMTTGYAIDITTAVADTATRIINVSSSMVSFFTTAKTLNQAYFTHTTHGSDVTGATVNGATSYLSSTALSQISYNGFNTVMVGTLTAAAGTQIINGFNCTPSGLTINSATTTFAGLRVDLTGITNTASAGVYGAYFSLASTATAVLASYETFKIITTQDTKTITFNSRNYSATSGDIIGFQSKPAANASGTQTVYGGQISPRFNDNVDGATLVGLQIEPILKGATILALSGDMRALDLRLTSEGANTVAGNTSGISFYNLLKSSTYTGGVHCMVVNNHGDTQPWTSFAKFVGGLGTNSCTTATDKTANAKSGTIIVDVDGTLYHIQLYANA